jgi:histidinol phosphatase-like enzyme (inositol monophosphatase family)
MISSSGPAPAPGEEDTAAILDVLESAAKAAAAITLGLFRSELTVENKWQDGFDPVTEADKTAELAIREIISARFPEHGIVGEEWDDKAASESDYTWIIDPIDGTRAFICGVPVWGTLVGLTHRGRAIAGLMAQPFTGELFVAAGEHGEYRRGQTSRPLRTSTVTRLSAAKLTATSPELFRRPEIERAWGSVWPRALQTRYGLDCYGYCLLAIGQIDLVVEAGLKDVDIAPLIPIIERAGGVITTWDGGPAEAGGNCVAAATPELHAEVITLLRSA